MPSSFAEQTAYINLKWHKKFIYDIKHKYCAHTVYMCIYIMHI